MFVPDEGESMSGRGKEGGEQGKEEEVEGREAYNERVEGGDED